MKSLPIYVKEIYQKNNHTFSILWSDGSLADYRLSDLQRRCPCAGCVDEVTGLRLSHAKPVDNDVKAITIKNVGRYALKIQFSEGCSTGIYSFDMLHNFNGAL